MAVEYGLYGELTDWVSDFNIDASGFQFRASQTPGNLGARRFSAYSKFSRFVSWAENPPGVESWNSVFFVFLCRWGGGAVTLVRRSYGVGKAERSCCVGKQRSWLQICVLFFLFFCCMREAQ